MSISCWHVNKTMNAILGGSFPKPQKGSIGAFLHYINVEKICLRWLSNGAQNQKYQGEARGAASLSVSHRS